VFISKESWLTAFLPACAHISAREVYGPQLWIQWYMYYRSTAPYDSQRHCVSSYELHGYKVHSRVIVNKLSLTKHNQYALGWQDSPPRLATIKRNEKIPSCKHNHTNNSHTIFRNVSNHFYAMTNYSFQLADGRTGTDCPKTLFRHRHFQVSGADLNPSSSSSHILILSCNCTFDTIVVLAVMFIT